MVRNGDKGLIFFNTFWIAISQHSVKNCQNNGFKAKQHNQFKLQKSQVMNVEDFPCNLSSLWHHSSRGEGRNYGRFFSFSADDFEAASPPKGLMENNCMRHAPRALFCDFWWKIEILMAWSKSTLSHVQARNWVFLVKTVKITVLTPLFPTFLCCQAVHQKPVMTFNISVQSLKIDYEVEKRI